ncbi:MAG: beta-N-acetylhexosaminidase, partial [Planctomycetota bacterium]
MIPKPVSATMQEGVFEITSKTVILVDQGNRRIGDFMADMLSPAMGFRLTVAQHAAGAPSRIELKQDVSLKKEIGAEGYRLKVSKDAVLIEAATGQGLFYGIMTVRQLLPVEVFREAKTDGVRWTVPCVKIVDKPRFQWRGMHLDVCRHFMSKEFVKKYIDLIALHKMNVFHWHLTEDQGWRIEIKRYPKLTEVGAWRKETILGRGRQKPRTFDGKPHGGFYTQADVREIVQYAAERFVTVVPEIEMPGHSQAAIAAYPELGNYDKTFDVCRWWGYGEDVFNVEESTITFLQNVLDEVLELFPSTYIHIGGDEVPKGHWKNSERTQARMKELGLKDEEELQSWFIKRMDTYLANKGRRLVGWDEILEGGLAPGATVMSWRGVAGGIAAAKAGHD